MKTNPKYYRVDRREIAFLRFIIEAYEGIAVLSTVDQHRGIVVLNIPCGCEEIMDSLICSLSSSIRIESFDIRQLSS